MASRDDIKFLSNPSIGKDNKKYCRFKKFGIRHIDYRDPEFLLQFVNEQGKLLPRRITGNSLKYQKKVAIAVKKSKAPFTYALRNRFVKIISFLGHGYNIATNNG